MNESAGWHILCDILIYIFILEMVWAFSIADSTDFHIVGTKQNQNQNKTEINDQCKLFNGNIMFWEKADYSRDN